MSNIKFIKNYPKKNYEHAVVAVDVVLLSVIDHRLKVLLIKLKEEPFAGSWALPGGLVAQNETLEQSAQRHLRDKAGAAHIHLEQLYTFGDPNRDPLGWVVSVAYLALVPQYQFAPKTSDRYSAIEWHDIEKLPQLAYDHKLIITKAHDRLRSKLEYTNIAYSLLPKEFTLGELQKLYESILCHELDKRNFRKKLISLDILKKLGKIKEGEANRPAQLYSFSKQSPQVVEIL